MLRLLFVAIIFLSTPIVKAQEGLTLAQLIETIKMNDDELETHLLSNGFVFSENKTDGPMTMKSYVKEKMNTTNQRVYIKSRFTVGGVETVIATYNTVITKEYLSIKTEAKTLGFTYKETIEYKGNSQLKYEKDNLVLTLIPTKGKTNEGVETGFPLYEVSVTVKKSN